MTYTVAGLKHHRPQSQQCASIGTFKKMFIYKSIKLWNETSNLGNPFMGAIQYRTVEPFIILSPNCSRYIIFINNRDDYTL